jgi:hypothetical protein
MGGEPLPKGALGTKLVVDENGEEREVLIEWHPMTIQWWTAWRKSPQATKMITGPDWEYLLETALMHHQLWTTKRFELAGEIRMRVSKFGATPEDRARLRLEIELPAGNSVGNARSKITTQNGVPDISTRRAKTIAAENARKAKDAADREAAAIAAAAEEEAEA